MYFLLKHTDKPNGQIGSILWAGAKNPEKASWKVLLTNYIILCYSKLVFIIINYIVCTIIYINIIEYIFRKVVWK